MTGVSECDTIVSMRMRQPLLSLSAIELLRKSKLRKNIEPSNKNSDSDKKTLILSTLYRCKHDNNLAEMSKRTGREQGLTEMIADIKTKRGSDGYGYFIQLWIVSENLRADFSPRSIWWG